MVLVVVGPALPVASLYYFYYYTGQSGGWMGSIVGSLCVCGIPNHAASAARIEGHLHSKCISQNVFLKMYFSKCIPQNVFLKMYCRVCKRI